MYRRYIRRSKLVRKAVRRPLGRGRYIKKNISYAKAKGFIKLIRKSPEIYLRNSPTAGLFQVNDPTTTCLQTGAPIADAVGGTYSIPFSLVFRLDQLIGSTDITGLCDAYKLKYVKVQMTYQSSSSQVNSLSIMPNITWIQDHDDGAVPSSINALREKMGSKMSTFGFNKLLKIGVVPKCADTVYNNGITSAYAVAKPMWLNSTYPSVEHYAIKGILSNVALPATSAALTSFKFDITTVVYGKDFQ